MSARRPFGLPRTSSFGGGGRAARALLCAVALASGGAALAFEDLNEAQALVYDRPHLAALETGDELVYRYRARIGDADEVLDRATLVVDGASDAERRDVTLDFLDGERELTLPPFVGYRGNPILIATLEHFAQTVAADAGGGALYVRNRIRDGLAREDASIERSGVSRDGATIDTTALSFAPFANDAFLGAHPDYGDATVRIVFSDDVPGGVLSIELRSGEGAEDRADAVPFVRELRLDDEPLG